VIHSENEFANGRNHINGIENFWGLSKVCLMRLGVHKHTFYYHLKECEMRSIHRTPIEYKHVSEIIFGLAV